MNPDLYLILFMLKKSYSILIVEDEPDFRTYLTILLKRLGAVIHPAPNVIEAFRLLGDQVMPDLVITDFNLPDTSGLEFISALRESGYRMPVVLISAVRSFSDREIVEAGAAAFLQKPFNAETLKEVIERSLENEVSAS